MHQDTKIKLGAAFAESTALFCGMTYATNNPYIGTGTAFLCMISNLGIATYEAMGEKDFPLKKTLFMSVAASLLSGGCGTGVNFLNRKMEHDNHQRYMEMQENAKAWDSTGIQPQ